AFAQAMRVTDFDFDLPEDRIALRPAEPRDAARLLVVDDPLQDAQVRDLGQFLRAGDVLVVNDTRVLPVQLAGERLRDGQAAGIEATLIKCVEGSVWQA